MGTLSRVFGRFGDPRAWDAPGGGDGGTGVVRPRPDLVGVLTEIARSKALKGLSVDAIRSADRALALAEELGLPRPARALGYRGLARAQLGDPSGRQDLPGGDRARAEAGQAREVALLYNNLGFELSRFERPRRGFPGGLA